MKGVYAVGFSLKKDRQIEIGRLGLFDFRKGFYLYVGSAMNSLEKRVSRHARKEKKMKWHIDYFSREAEFEYAVLLESDKKIECELNDRIAGLGGIQLIKGFGSSDCKCNSHFHYFKKKAEFEEISSAFNDA